MGRVREVERRRRIKIDLKMKMSKHHQTLQSMTTKKKSKRMSVSEWEKKNLISIAILSRRRPLPPSLFSTCWMKLEEIAGLD